MPAMFTPTHPDELAFLARLDEHPLDAACRGAYADWLDEHDRPAAAAALRADWLGVYRGEPGPWGFGMTHSADATTDGMTVLPVPVAGDVLCGLLVGIGSSHLYLPRAIVSESHTEVRTRGGCTTSVRVKNLGPFKWVRGGQVTSPPPAR
jgi:uncharacterized protein (TIGR02996 family)